MNIQLSNELLPKSQREWLRYPGQQICLSAECDKVSTQDSHQCVIAAICCHNLMRMRYPAIHNAALDHEDDNNNAIPGEWQRGNTWEQELQCIHDYRETKAGKQLREYLKHYYNSAAGAVPWQHDNI